MNQYEEGNKVKCIGVWTNEARTAIDPTAVFFKVKDPSGNVTTYEYLTDVELVKDSTGNYHVLVDADEDGVWVYRFYSTGTGQAAGERSFLVTDTAFD